MRLNIYQVDAFTQRTFGGSPAAVVPLEKWLPEHLMQAIAAENSVPETAFYVLNAQGRYEIRWFSPVREIDFCGHATLASAFILFQSLPVPQAIFWAKAVGEMPVRGLPDGRIELSFPNRKPVPLTEVPAALRETLSITPVEYWVNQQAYFAVYASEADVRNVVARLDTLKTLGPLDVVATAPGSQHDFTSRYFWPDYGGEDPVTGSIHAGLAPFWAERLGKTTLLALQASQRGGELACQLEGDRVFVAGHAVQYLQGVIDVSAQ